MVGLMLGTRVAYVISLKNMNPNIFTSEEQNALKECLSAIKNLSIFKSNEFEDIFGLSKSEVIEIEESFPDWDLHDEKAVGKDDSWLAINNSFAFFLNGTEEEKKILRESISFSEDFLINLIQKFEEI